MLNKPPEGKEK